MITINELHKEFRVYKKRFGMIRDLLGLAKENLDYDIVTSLKNITLEIPVGETHGIIGMNGAGKSTLLKILTGVLDPSGGEFNISGIVSTLLELGTGFHPELSGRENVYLNGTMMGFTRDEVEQKLLEIIRFAELGAFFDRPVKIYSSGMYVRLAFSFAVAVNPDILIIDEALSVGDAYFQQKCIEKIKSFKKIGTTILFVSHDLGAVRMLCDRVTLLANGNCLYTGDPMSVLDLYNDILADHKNHALNEAKAKTANDISFQDTYESGNHAMEIRSAALLNEKGQETTIIESGKNVSVLIEAEVFAEQINNPTCGILFRDRLGYDVFGTNTLHLNVACGRLRQGQRAVYRFDFSMNLGPGIYTLTAALHKGQTHVDDNYHWQERLLIFKVMSSNDFDFIGVARLTPECSITLK